MTNADRVRLLSEANEILRKSTFTKEDSSRVENLLALADRYSDIDLKKVTMRERDIELGRTSPTPEPTPADVEFRSYLFAREQSTAKELAEQRALSVGTDSGGGYLVPQAFAQRFEVALRKGDGIIDAATTFEMARGNAFNYPVLEDTSTNNIATVVAENVISISGPDLVFAAVAFSKAAQWRSGFILASTELVSDSAFDFGNLLADAGAVRLAKGIGVAMITTLLAGSTSGLTAGSATVISADEVYALIDSVDEAYGSNGSFVMKQSTLSTLRRLKASTGGSYMFPPERSPEGLPMLAGHRVYISPSMPAQTTGLKPIVFGDLSRLARRVVSNSLTVLALVERYAEFSEIAYEVRQRTDFQLLKTSSSQPTKFITMA